MTRSQLAWSRLEIPMAMGEPSVTPPRTPPSKIASSFSIFMRPPRPYPCCRRASSRFTKPGSIRRPAGIPSRIAVRRGPCDSPAVVSLRGMAESLAQVESEESMIG